jgi:hypothetical protein
VPLPFDNQGMSGTLLAGHAVASIADELLRQFNAKPVQGNNDDAISAS